MAQRLEARWPPQGASKEPAHTAAFAGDGRNLAFRASVRASGLGAPSSQPALHFFVTGRCLLCRRGSVGPPAGAGRVGQKLLSLD